MKRSERLSFAGVKTYSVHTRTNLVTIRNMARPYEDGAGGWLPAVGERQPFERLVDLIVGARAAGKPVIWSMGAHVIKNGLSRYVIELVRSGIVTHVSGNGATSIHDFELALLGETSEDVATAIEDGSFGMWEETGRFMNEAIRQGAADNLGYGESLYRYLDRHPERFPHYDDCVFVQCQRAGVPYTCHISIGTDIIHQHPVVDFEALGKASGNDFGILCQSVSEMADGGVFLNFGSAISGPEIFLKALSLCRNQGLAMAGIAAANFDIVPVFGDSVPEQTEAEFYYRPRRNFVDRLGGIGGQGFLFHGLHQQTIPGLFHRVLERKKELGAEFPVYARKERLSRDRVKLYPVAERSAALRAEMPAEEARAGEEARTEAEWLGGAEAGTWGGAEVRPGAEAGTRVGAEARPGAEAEARTEADRLGGPEAQTGLAASVKKPGDAGALAGAEWSGASDPAFAAFVRRVSEAGRAGAEVIFSLGGNVVGAGVSPDLIALIESGPITHLAMNGCAAFQDLELAAFGQTEERDGDSLARGRLGMWREPGELLHGAIREGYRGGLGYGESLMAHMEAHPGLYPHRKYSLLHACARSGIPCTVHVTLGTDAIQQHPDVDFALQGGASGRDFHSYAHTVSRLEGGVYANFGSTVTGPEVLLKALSIARNLGHAVRRITTANFDLVRLGDYRRKVGYEDWDYYYRPRKNIIHRPTSLGGQGYHFEGPHQLTIPALRRALLSAGIKERDGHS